MQKQCKLTPTQLHFRNKTKACQLIKKWIKIAYCNCRGISKPHKREMIEKWALDKGIQILVVTETKFARRFLTTPADTVCSPLLVPTITPPIIARRDHIASRCYCSMPIYSLIHLFIYLCIYIPLCLYLSLVIRCYLIPPTPPTDKTKRK